MDHGTHSQRIGDYCAMIAEGLGVERGLLAPASRLHDIGMSAAATPAVHSPGPMRADQLRAMQAHTVVGHAMLRASASPVLDLAADIALTHHERFDGAGYPRGLAGAAIPLGGRIMAVADTFDAITTSRPYRLAAPIGHAADVLCAERSGQFDPLVVDVFLDAIDEAAAILKRHPPRSDRPARASRPLTLTDAAAALRISTARLRRWADEGRIECTRTTGGHRRFPVHAVHSLAAQLGVRAEVRRLTPPYTPLPAVAGILVEHGRELAASAARSLYTGKTTGWFATDGSGIALDVWLARTADACRSGDYGGVSTAVAQLMRVAEGHAASLLERHAFLERFSQALTRVLLDVRAPREEIVAARQLFVALQHAALAASDVISPAPQVR